MKNLLKQAGLLVILVLMCSIIVRVFSNSETLSQHAARLNAESSGNTDTSTQDVEDTSSNYSHIDKPIDSRLRLSDYLAANQKYIDSSIAYSSENSTGKISANNSSVDSSADSSVDTSSNSSATNSSGNLSTKSSVNPSPKSTTTSAIPEKSEADDSLLSDNSISTEIVTYQTGFYYEPLSDEIKNRITGISYPADSTVPYDDLRYVGLLYYDFDGNVQTGELICNKGIAQDMVEIFYQLYLSQYQIAKMVLIDTYNADDTASMADNNTSCFNYRTVDGTTHLSKHAYGLAIDLNPFNNPYVENNSDGTVYISPLGSEAYADRTANLAHMINENDLCYQLFIQHGFTWGGSWKSYKDYQHFQKLLN